ncbi:YjdJ family protein [Paenisporosarcina quisquiliarum]|uniref:YjdJ family protein n=1 Tax=Paenisporosarcina quisquiliarum TaxID=365346 RepID=A0A9X3LIY9_9BACL|nr:YjdJ family protein [Paenisporosarcina quisquiliarum]MCZ8538647.1 YjdJ family protein [Paenisporosarcina quisquiliarum]
MFKYVLQLIVGIFTLVVSTFIAWYEGSAITYKSLEWGYSTPFTKILNIEITNGRDISQLDYFVYAAKFQPLFPAIMMVSVFYILSIVGYYLVKYKPKWAIGFLGLIGCIMILLSGFIFNSPTIGGRVFFWITLVSGLISIAVAFFVCLRNFKYTVSVNTN